ncbi:hypothetical protein FRC12_003164 [Ceratobasidium sp. 428]|nr:hypothetical protein FRC12_003164 [Ceratobasidium sp. 428]
MEDMDIDGPQPSSAPLDSDSLLPTFAEPESDHDMSTCKFDPHQQPIRHVYASGTIYNQPPDLDVRRLLLTARTSKYAREDPPPAIVRDYSNHHRPPNPDSWVDDDPLLTFWEAPTIPATSSDPPFDWIPLPQPAREIAACEQPRNRRSQFMDSARLTSHSEDVDEHFYDELIDDIDAVGELQPEHLDKDDAVGLDPISGSEHEDEDALGDHPEEEDANHLEHLEPEVYEPEPDVNEDPEGEPEDPDINIEAVFENHPVLQNIYI